MSNKEQLIEFINNFTDADDAELLLCLMKRLLKHKPHRNYFHEVIYCIKHNVTGKEYIGRTGAIEMRIACHMSLLKKGKHIVEDMQSDYDKYGEDYTITVLDEITDNSKRKREYELIESHGSYIREKGYNYKDKCFLCWKRNKE